MATFPAVRHVFHTAAIVTADGDACLLAGLATVAVQVEGVIGDTITFEGTIDGATWYSVQAMNIATGAVATTATADGLYVASVAGLEQFRARLVRVGGTVTVTGRAVSVGSLNFADVDVAGAESVTIAAGEAHTGQVGGHTVISQTEFTRPADTTAYAALDTVCNSTGSPAALIFTGVARVAAGSGYITRGRIMTSQTTCTARFRLHLFTVTPTPIADNSPYTLLYANRANRIGVLDFHGLRTEGAGSTAANQQNVTDRLPFVCAAASTTIYGILETLDAFTPANAQTFFIGLGVEQN